MVPRGQLKCQQVDDGFPPQLFKHLTPGSAVTRVPSPFNNKISLCMQLTSFLVNFCEIEVV